MIKCCTIDCAPEYVYDHSFEYMKEAYVTDNTAAYE